MQAMSPMLVPGTSTGVHEMYMEKGKEIFDDAEYMWEYEFYKCGKTEEGGSKDLQDFKENWQEYVADPDTYAQIKHQQDRFQIAIPVFYCAIRIAQRIAKRAGVTEKGKLSKDASQEDMLRRVATGIMPSNFGAGIADASKRFASSASAVSDDISDAPADATEEERQMKDKAGIFVNNNMGSRMQFRLGERGRWIRRAETWLTGLFSKVDQADC